MHRDGHLCTEVDEKVYIRLTPKTVVDWWMMVCQTTSIARTDDAGTVLREAAFAPKQLKSPQCTDHGTD